MQTWNPPVEISQTIPKSPTQTFMKYIVWIQERGQPWEENGDGPTTQKQAERIATEIRQGCGCRAFALPVGVEPSKRSLLKHIVFQSSVS